ncbi:hypothetical protein [Streptomyces luteolus]|uniref:DUF2946 domain-containing protein n=1 Tax=Streptomyces luteolus TaxID=3043615 RepID=A0ABT6SZ52_9ACTN|nr:hypothetical protein [Streptomyces sp. B-S-A12]MDI3420883.1 hypothetical protein [Streptomyces sp. B-S-A12]
MKVSKYVRAGGALAHLLLVVVLAFGVFVMHTVGHPDEPSGAGMSAGAHASAMHGGAGMSAGAHASAMHGGANGDAATTDAAMTTAAGHESVGAHHRSADEPASGMAMDMTSLCVAVLGVWAFAALLYAAFARRPAWLADLLARTVVALRPHAPPLRPDLTQLSVLRI